MGWLIRFLLVLFSVVIMVLVGVGVIDATTTDPSLVQWEAWAFATAFASLLPWGAWLPGGPGWWPRS